MTDTTNNTEGVDEGILPPGQAIAEEIAASQGHDISEDEVSSDVAKTARKYSPILEDPATRVAFIAGFFSMIITLLSALLK